jgi:hypothetical protein
VILGIRYLEGNNKDILIIAPHGSYETKEEIIKYRNDLRTGIIAEEIHNILGCFTIINDAYIRPDEDDNETASLKDKRLDLFKVKQAEEVPGYLKAIQDAVDNHDGKTLVIWLHGIFDNNADSEKIEHVKAKLMKKGGGDLHALIGYGQGKPSRYTAEQKTVEKIRDELTKLGLKTLITRKDAGNYCGRDTDRLNQWFLINKYPLDKVQSFQIEIRYKGFREDAEQCQNTARIIAGAISATLEMKPIVMEGAVETQLVEPTIPDENTTEETVVALTLSQEEATASKVPAENTSKKSLDKKEDDDAVAETAYMWLTDQFKKHITNFMHEAGKYIIKNFYNNDPMLAFAKNKTSEQPPSLNLLIKKIQQSSKNPSESAPSVSWFYKAVNLAAHEAICKQMGLSTFTILGHSHKLQLLYVPKLKSIQADMLDKSITPAFQEKERLAIVAHEKGFSVRDFKKYIDGQYPEETINLTASPSMADLQSLGPKKLERLRKITQKKIEDSQKLIAAYTASLMDMDAVLAEIHCAAAEGKDQKKK